MIEMGDDDLETVFTAEEQIDVSTINGIIVDAYGVGMGSYATFLFKLKVGAANAFKVEWAGRTTLNCEISPIYLQALNRVTGLWETLASELAAPADTTIILRGSRFLNVPDFKNTAGEIAFRVYQKIK